jgi:hypothetical protein
MRKRLLSLLLSTIAAAGCAQSVPRADGTAPLAKVPPLEYQSAFAGYAPFGDEPTVPWRDANETVKDAAEHGAKP